MSKKCGLGKFVLGVAVGAGLGVLFAPKKGSETREDLKNLFEEMLNKAKNIKASDVKMAIEEKIEDIKAGLADLDKEKVLSIAKEKGAQLKAKCEELVIYDKEKGTPVVEKTAEKLRLKTIDVVKNVLDKLEKAEPKAAK